ncbi:MAG: hypothetical protein Q9193_005267, partial [Seirophora villosa]
MPATAPPPPREVLLVHQQFWHVLAQELTNLPSPQSMLKLLKDSQDAEYATIPKELRDEAEPGCTAMQYVGDCIRADTRLQHAFVKVNRALKEYNAYLHLENQ